MFSRKKSHVLKPISHHIPVQVHDGAVYLPFVYKTEIYLVLVPDGEGQPMFEKQLTFGVDEMTGIVA